MGERTKVNFNAYGYSSFKCDITSYCHPAGEVNTIAVKVTNEGKNSVGMPVQVSTGMYGS